MSDSRKLWIGCLSSYNAGNVYGQWFHLEDYSDVEELQDAVTSMIKGEEWHICDYEGFHGLTVGRYESLDTVFSWHEMFEENEHVPDVVISHLIQENRTANIGDIYHGTYSRRGDYAAEMHEGIGDIPEHLQAYIDWEAMERNLEMGGDISVLEDGCERHILCNHA